MLSGSISLLIVKLRGYRIGVQSLWRSIPSCFQFVLADRNIDLSKGEAASALRSGDTDRELVGRNIMDSISAVYASCDDVNRNGAP